MISLQIIFSIFCPIQKAIIKVQTQLHKALHQSEYAVSEKNQASLKNSVCHFVAISDKKKKNIINSVLELGLNKPASCLLILFLFC